MPGTLYVVATPIGNLDDMPPRVAATFGLADFVAAEDTRVTLKLLNHLGLKKPMVSYFEHNAAQRGGQILARIQAGENCALCSDAGMPAISDPGEQIVTDALELGFLPVPRRARAQRLESLKREERTVIFYEAPHKLRGTLADLAGAFGEQRSLTLCRELTKLHEEIFKTTIGGAMARYAEEAPRGEFVLVMAGAAPEETEETPPTLEEAVAAARALMAQGQSASAAAKAAAAQSPFGKGEIYRLLCREEEGDE